MKENRVDAIIRNDDVDTLQQVNDGIAGRRFRDYAISMLQFVNSYILDSYVSETHLENGKIINVFNTNSKFSKVYREAYTILKALTDQNLISEDMHKYDSPDNLDVDAKLIPIFTKNGIRVEVAAPKSPPRLLNNEIE